MADSKPALPRVFAYPVRYTPRSTDAALAATTLLLPHGFLIDGSPSGLQTTIAERLAMLQRPRADTADLFFGFLPLYGPPMSTWTEDDHRLMHSMGPEREDYIPISLRVRVHRMCEQLGNSTLMRTQLPHLTRRTLKRHVLVTPFVPHACDHEARLTGRPFPPRREWLSHIILELNVDNLVSRDDIRHRRISMPYLSSVRWSRAWQGVPPWQRAPPTERNAAQSRSHLVSFTGSLRGQPISMQLRTRLVASCRARAAHVCAAHVSDNFPILAPEESSDAERMSMRRALRLKLHSTFCLEPPGFSPPRKSSLDSMLSGCIPVFFYSDEEFASLWPFHMGGLHGWGANASVRVPLEAALDGSVDVIEYLQAVPEARIRAMQSMLAAHAHTLLYGIGPYSGDAIETMLAALHAGLSRPARARH
eukprot:jgi/Chrpa1/10393/Chrysochromulina_OHIO_Genome00020300-RA